MKSHFLPDTSLERNVLMKNAVPKIQMYCADQGLHFQLVDLWWGMGGEEGWVGWDQQLRRHEISKCQQSSIGPYFVVSFLSL